MSKFLEVVLCLTLASVHYKVVVGSSDSSGISGLFAELKSSNELVEPNLEQESSSKSQQEGSWSQWWSYDGISGPDYWNINKRWSLCNSGRKQSPIDVRTDRLVYDHLLGPIHLNWLDPSSTSPVHSSAAPNRILDHTNEGTLYEESSSQVQKSVRVELVNSGRGIEAWLEPANTPTKSADFSTESPEFILSHGPLSYAYKLFKIELHSASNFGSQQRPLNSEEARRQQESAMDDEDFGEQVPEALKSGKSSEHLIDGAAFEGELQLHFYNRHLASSGSRAQQLALESRPNLFAAISVFIVSRKWKNASGRREEPKEDLRLAQQTPLDFMLDNLSAVPNQGDTVELKLTRAHIESLVTDRQHYITYQGSMNRPPCAESVDWILLNKALKVDQHKLVGLFEKLSSNQENIRPVRALNRRLLRTTISSQLESLDKWRRTGSECSQGNCTVAEHHNSRNQQEGGEKKVQALGPASTCSMKPNYAYQFTYSGKHLY